VTPSRIVLVSPYALGVFGGVQEQVLAMSRELGRRGHEVLIVAPDRHDRTSCETTAKVMRFGRRLTLPANGSRAPLTLSPRASRQALRSIREFAPEVVHFHEPFAPLLGWAALRAHVAPAVGTFHRSGAGPALELTKPLLRALSKGLDAAAAVSESASLTIERAAGVQAEVLFNGTEMERFVETPRERSGETVLVTIGRLEERKGTAHAISAVRAHNARGEDQWRLVVIGDGPLRAQLQALAGHDESIVFAGALGDAEKRVWLRRASALLAPATRGESFGMVLLEAMASETVVVASDISGYREAVGAHGILFAPGDEAAIEAATSKALAGETPQAVAAAKDYAQRWSMAALMDVYDSLYATARERFEAAR
jgi:phosphatidylinositol alpha-mannosyltransferase